MANIGKNIKTMRTKRNMTQDQLAAFLFVTRQTVSNYENNKSNPDIDMLMKIAEVLETDVNTLIYGTQEQEKIRKNWKKAVLLILGSILGGVVLFEIQDYLKELNKKYYIGFELYYFYLFVKPLFYLIIGWIGMELLCLVFQIKMLSDKVNKWIAYIVLGVLVLYVIIILLFMMGAGYTVFFRFVVNILDGEMVWFLIPGVLLRIAGVGKKRTL